MSAARDAARDDRDPAGRDASAVRETREAREAARRTPSGAPHRRLPPLLPARVRRALVSLLIVVTIAALYLFVLTRGAIL